MSVNDQEWKKLIDVLSGSPEETYSLGRKIGKQGFPGLAVLLYGELGTGKTVLAKGISEELGAKATRSPSFTLINEYAGHIPIAHIDLYRLSSEEAEELPFEEYVDEGFLLIIEWADRLKSPPFDEILAVHFDFLLPESDSLIFSEKRILKLEAKGRRASAILKSLTDNLEN